MEALMLLLACCYGLARGMEFAGGAARSKYQSKRDQMAAKKATRKGQPKPTNAKAVSAGVKAAAATATVVTGAGVMARGFREGCKQGWPEGKERAQERWARKTMPPDPVQDVQPEREPDVDDAELTGPQEDAVRQWRCVWAPGGVLCGKPVQGDDLYCADHQPENVTPNSEPRPKKPNNGARYHWDCEGCDASQGKLNEPWDNPDDALASYREHVAEVHGGIDPRHQGDGETSAECCRYRWCAQHTPVPGPTMEPVIHDDDTYVGPVDQWDADNLSEDERNLADAGKCAWQTGAGLPGTEYCLRPCADGEPFCLKHCEIRDGGEEAEADLQDEWECEYPRCPDRAVAGGRYCPRHQDAVYEHGERTNFALPNRFRDGEDALPVPPKRPLRSVPDPNGGTNNMAVMTQAGGEVVGMEQLKAEMDGIAEESAADLDDAQAAMLRAQENKLQVEAIAARMQELNADAETVGDVLALLESFEASENAARARVTAAEASHARATATKAGVQERHGNLQDAYAATSHPADRAFYQPA